MKEVVIFGAGRFAEVVRFYFENDSEYSVAGHTVDKEYIDSGSFKGLPFVEFDEVQKIFPPERYLMFIAVGSQRVNQLRSGKYQAAEEKGYRFASYISSRATIVPGLEYGPNTLIVEGSSVGPFVRLGKNVFILGSRLHHHCSIDDHCTIAEATLAGSVSVGTHTFIGLNASVSQSVSIARRNVIGDGSIIRDSTKDNEVYRPPRTKTSSISSDRLSKLG